MYVLVKSVCLYVSCCCFGHLELESEFILKDFLHCGSNEEELDQQLFGVDRVVRNVVRHQAQ